MTIMIDTLKMVTDAHTFQLRDEERELLGGCNFLTKERIMQRLLEWKPIRSLVWVHTLLCDFDGKATHKRSEMFVLPKDEDAIILKLANLSDLHGIVGLNSGSLWLTRTSDPSELNIDADVIDALMRKIGWNGEKKGRR